jgi:hypothetical protein
MKRQPKIYIPPLNLPFTTTAKLFDITPRSLDRWNSLGLPRNQDGTIPFPTAGLWFQILKHRYDDRCQRQHELDLLFLLKQFIRVFPDHGQTIGEGQRLLRQLAGFQLDDATIEQIRKA